MKLVSATDTIAKFEADYNNCCIRYGDMKKQLGEDMVKFIQPIREKTIELQRDEVHLQKLMKMGKEKARESASNT
jgi:tryptophanyl-tRNA synthetase